ADGPHRVGRRGRDASSDEHGDRHGGGRPGRRRRGLRGGGRLDELPDRSGGGGFRGGDLRPMKIEPPNRRIAILLSGRGSNFMAIADWIREGALKAEIALVLANREEAPG